MKSKKQFFKEKVEAVTYSLWDKEFKLAKSRQVREEVRLERDRTVEAIINVTKRVEAEQDKEAKTKLQSELDVLKGNQTRFEAQMDMVDHQINGFGGDEKHEPIIGILEELQSLNELKNMYKDYASKI